MRRGRREGGRTEGKGRGRAWGRGRFLSPGQSLGQRVCDDRLLPNVPFPLSLLSSATPDHSSLLLHVKQLVSDLRSLSCQMAALQGNGEGRGGGEGRGHQPHFLDTPTLGSISALHPPTSGSERTCCPINWVEFEGSCYWFSSSSRSWIEADKYCQLENAHLVVVTSWDEQVRPCGAFFWDAGRRKEEVTSSVSFLRDLSSATWDLQTLGLA